MADGGSVRRASALNELSGREIQTMGIFELIILVLLFMLIAGSAPVWTYNRGWGYYPSGGLATLLVIVLILVLLF